MVISFCSDHILTQKYGHLNGVLIVCLCPGIDYWYVSLDYMKLGSLGALIDTSGSHDAFFILMVSHFTTIE